MKAIRNEGPRAHGPRKGILAATILLLSIISLVIVGTQSVVALDPHIVTGSVYEANGTLVPANCTVTVTNARTGESANTTTNGTGVYAYNLLNLPSGWAYGDTIQVTAYNATNATGTNSTQLVLGALSTGIDVWIGTTTAVSGVNFYIIDEDGNPVEGALINIKDSSGDIVTTKMTDSGGKASATLNDGTYTVTVSKSGYEDEVRTIRVHGSATYVIRLGVEDEAGVTLTGIWYWLLIIFAMVGVITVLFYIYKKV